MVTDDDTATEVAAHKNSPPELQNHEQGMTFPFRLLRMNKGLFTDLDKSWDPVEVHAAINLNEVAGSVGGYNGKN